MSRWQFPRQVRRFIASGLAAVLISGPLFIAGALPVSAPMARAADRDSPAAREERERRWYEERRDKRDERQLEREREDTSRQRRDAIENEREQDWQRRRKAIESLPGLPGNREPGR